MAMLPPQPTRQDFWLANDSLFSHLNDRETFWRDVQPFLASKGYALRPRYYPDWVPTWRLHGGSHLAHGWPRSYEDALSTRTMGRIMDALRLSDTKRVALKRVKKTPRGYEEIAIMKYFSTEPRRSDPRNRCVPLLDVLDPGDEFPQLLIVIPLLLHIDEPAYFHNISEVLEFCHQILEGLAFMHDHNTEHRDCCRGNIMMDGEPLYPKGRHPVAWTHKADFGHGAKYLRRSDIPIQYYFIDFGLAVRFESFESRRPLISPRGQDTTAPELQDRQATDGFVLDVYCVGNMFRRELLSRFPQLTPILSGIVEAMTRAAPQERPTADKANAWMDEIRAGLSKTQLFSRLRFSGESMSSRFFADAIYQAGNIKRLILRNQAALSANYRKALICCEHSEPSTDNTSGSISSDETRVRFGLGAEEELSTS